jgi:Ca2+/Na+ antiporter
MIGYAVLGLVLATMAVGLYMGIRYLRHLRNRPSIIGLHFILGFLSLEPLAFLLRGAMSTATPRPSLVGILGGCGIMLALVSGVTAVMVGRKSRQTANVTLATHVSLATGAFLLLATWVFTA